MEYTKEKLREEMIRIIKSNTLCSEGEAFGASGNIIEIPLISAAPDMYEALKKLINSFTTTAMMVGLSNSKINGELEASQKALAKAESK